MAHRAAIGLVLAAMPALAAAQPLEGRFDCLIEPNKLVKIASAVPGTVAAIHVGRGERVGAGQILASLEASLQRAEVDLAAARAKDASQIEARRARLAFEERRLKRNESLMAEKVITDQEADEIKTAHALAQWELKEAMAEAAIARLDLARAEAQLALREIKSPFEGLVVKLDLGPGESVQGASILTLVALDPLHVELFLPIAIMDRVAVGAPVEIFPDVPGRAPLAGTVTVVDRVADAASSTFAVRADVPNKDYSTPAGLKCQAAIRLDPATPQDATATAP